MSSAGVTKLQFGSCLWCLLTLLALLCGLKHCQAGLDRRLKLGPFYFNPSVRGKTPSALQHSTPSEACKRSSIAAWACKGLQVTAFTTDFLDKGLHGPAKICK